VQIDPSRTKPIPSIHFVLCVYLCSPRAFLCVCEAANARECVKGNNARFIESIHRGCEKPLANLWAERLLLPSSPPQRVGILWISRRGIWFQVAGALCDNGPALASRWKKGVICITFNDWWTDAAIRIMFLRDLILKENPFKKNPETHFSYFADAHWIMEFQTIKIIRHIIIMKNANELMTRLDKFGLLFGNFKSIFRKKLFFSQFCA